MAFQLQVFNMLLYRDRERERDTRRERDREKEGRSKDDTDFRRPPNPHRNTDWDHETPRTDGRLGKAGGETPYSKIKGMKVVL